MDGINLACLWTSRLATALATCIVAKEVWEISGGAPALNGTAAPAVLEAASDGGGTKVSPQCWACEG